MNNSVVASSERTGKGARGFACMVFIRAFCCVPGYRVHLDERLEDRERGHIISDVLIYFADSYWQSGK